MMIAKVAAEVPFDRQIGRLLAAKLLLAAVAWLVFVELLCGGLYGQELDSGSPRAQQATRQQDLDLSEIEVPIIDRDPFDRIHFDQAYGNRMLDVDPLQLEGYDENTPIDPAKVEGQIVFTMPDYPGRRFSVQMSYLVKIERYWELVLAESRQAMQRKDYGTAFRTLIFLSEETSLGNSVEVRQNLDLCLAEDGELNLQRGNFSEAMAAFEELNRRNPRYRLGGGATVLDKIILCIDRFVGLQVEAGEFQRARLTLQQVRAEYGERLERLLTKWNDDMQQRALEELRQVRSFMDNGQAAKSHKSVRRLMYVMPDLPQSGNAFEAVVEKYPFVYVGVAQPALDTDVRRIENWAARRVGRLTRRWLMEYHGPGEEGGKYLFPNGRIQRVDDLGLKFRIQITKTPGQVGIPPITSYEISNRLLDLADPNSEDYYIPWERMVETIELEDENSLVFTLRNPHVRPEALLPIPYYPLSDPRSSQANGLYEEVQVDADEADDNETVYELNKLYARPAANQFPRIIERLYKNSSQATDALLRGDIDVVDRVFPADIPRLRNSPMIEVKPYVVPTIHLLIPNPRNNRMLSDHFRRAIHFGIDRRLIIKELISGGTAYDGYVPVTGPFPPGTESADQLAYAYNNNVEMREYDGRLAIVLGQQYVQQEKIRLEQLGEINPDVPPPTLVLAHPDNDLIATASAAIAQQLKSVYIDCTLRVLPPGVSIPGDDDYDLLYCELQMQEPLVDADRLFGKQGIVKISDPTVEQALRQLDRAYSWNKVSLSLRSVHQQSSNNLTVLPLWQLVEHYAYRKNVYNLGDNLVYLYQNVDRWRISGQQAQVSQK